MSFCLILTSVIKPINSCLFWSAVTECLSLEEAEAIWLEIANPYWAFRISFFNSVLHGIIYLAKSFSCSAQQPWVLKRPFKPPWKSAEWHTWDATALTWKREGISSVTGLCSPNLDLVSTNRSVNIRKGNFPLIDLSFKRAGVFSGHQG